MRYIAGASISLLHPSALSTRRTAGRELVITPDKITGFLVLQKKKKAAKAEEYH
jgi:hypothetical protein